jgi:hypothetical protein
MTEINIDIMNSVGVDHNKWSAFGVMWHIETMFHSMPKEDNKSQTSQASLGEMGIIPLLNVMKWKVVVVAVENT